MRVCSLVGLAAIVAGCGAPDDPAEQLDVYAASSLTEAFGELEGVFEAAHQGVDVRMTFAGSQVLRLQIEQGAAADLFASADQNHMQALADADLVRDPHIFVHNELVVIVPLDNPAGIESLEDLPRAERLVLGTANVPAGRYAREMLGHAAAELGEDFELTVLSRLVSEESNVRLARAKVELGEADAAVVYRTDAASSDLVRIVPIPTELNVIADYAIAILRRTKVPDPAKAWIDLLNSDDGREVLRRHGFIVE